jgi:trimethylamine--corrinoid protein Co-methyltransferase
MTQGKIEMDLGASWYPRLSRDACAQIDVASRSILERTGVRMHYAPAVDLLKKAGATVDEGNRVRIPSKLVDFALDRVPKSITMYTRQGEPAMYLEGYHSYFGVGSDCMNIVDHHTWEFSKPLLQDVVDGISLVDELPQIDFAMSMFMPVDVDQVITDRYQMEVMLNYTTKPLIYVTYDYSGTPDCVEMANIVAGGEDAFAAKPFAINYINVTSSMNHNEDSLERLFYMAKRNMPVIYAPMGGGGMTGPVTIAGGTALGHAGVLAGVVVSQLVREGSPIILPGGGSGTLDMRTMVTPYSSPDGKLGYPMGHYHNLPIWSAGGFTEAKLVDQQAAMEASLSLLSAALAGGHLIHDVGYMESGLCGSLAQVAICNEIIAWIKRATRTIEISEDTLALDLIDELGPDGNFLETDHTFDHFRTEHWYPEIIDRDNRDNWLAKGGLTMAERAAKRVDQLLECHVPPHLPADVAADIRAVVKRAEAEFDVVG